MAPPRVKPWGERSPSRLSLDEAIWQQARHAPAPATPTIAAPRSAPTTPPRPPSRKGTDKHDRIDLIISMLPEQKLDTQRGFDSVKGHLDDVVTRMDRRNAEVDAKFTEVHEYRRGRQRVAQAAAEDGEEVRRAVPSHRAPPPARRGVAPQRRRTAAGAGMGIRSQGRGCGRLSGGRRLHQDERGAHVPLLRSAAWRLCVCTPRSRGTGSWRLSSKVTPGVALLDSQPHWVGHWLSIERTREEATRRRPCLLVLDVKQLIPVPTKKMQHDVNRRIVLVNGTLSAEHGDHDVMMWKGRLPWWRSSRRKGARLMARSRSM